MSFVIASLLCLTSTNKDIEIPEWLSEYVWNWLARNKRINVSADVGNGLEREAETSTDTFHDALETHGETSSSDYDEDSGDDSSWSGSGADEERPQTVRRSARTRVPRRVLTYESLGADPKITRYTLHSRGKHK